jgi:hypothetical protein
MVKLLELSPLPHRNIREFVNQWPPISVIRTMRHILHGEKLQVSVWLARTTLVAGVEESKEPFGTCFPGLLFPCLQTRVRGVQINPFE